jgi:hypothetical protein
MRLSFWVGRVRYQPTPTLATSMMAAMMTMVLCFIPFLLVPAPFDMFRYTIRISFGIESWRYVSRSITVFYLKDR